MSNIIENEELDHLLKIEQDIIVECSEMMRLLTPNELLKLANDEDAMEAELADRLSEREYNEHNVMIDWTDIDDTEHCRKYVPSCLVQYYGTSMYNKAYAYYKYVLKRMVRDNNNNRICPDTP